MIGEIRDGACFICKRDVWDLGWELHEIQPDRWEMICQPCEQVTGISEGK